MSKKEECAWCYRMAYLCEGDICDKCLTQVDEDEIVVRASQVCPEDRFRDPGGESALHPGVRTEECPTCGRPNALTKRDVRAGYQCDGCARELEMGY
jgi:hypothetical protein